MKVFLTACILMTCLILYNKNKVNDSAQNVQTVDDSIKQMMFNLAYTYDSTAPYYIVAIIKNKNTNEIKEVCTEALFLEGALHIEFEKDYNFNLDSGITRYFELSKDSALWNISFDLYTQEELLLYKNTLNLDSIIDIVKKEKNVRKNFTPQECENNKREMFAHIMFNYGIMMTRGCIVGNLCRLVLYDSTKVGIPFLEPDWDYY